jgi:hypothetical protein
MLLQAMFFDDLLYHSFILPYIAVEETVLQPNAGPQARPEAGARQLGKDKAQSLPACFFIAG